MWASINMKMILILWVMCRLEERLQQATAEATTRTRVMSKIDVISEDLTKLNPAAKLYNVV